MYTNRRSGGWPRLDALTMLVREHVVSGLVVVLAALAAVSFAVVLTADLQSSAVAFFLVAMAAISVAAAAVGFAEREAKLAGRFEGEAGSYRQILNEHFLVSKVDANGRFLEANQNLLDRTGYSQEELARQSLGGPGSGPSSPEILSAMWASARSGRTWSGEYRDRGKDGEPFWVKAIVVPWRNARGELECLTTIGVDVTEQRSAEQELKRAHARLEAFIKHVPAAVAMFDTDMRYIAHTDCWLHDYNLRQTSLVGLCHYDVFPEIPEHWRAKHRRILAGATESKLDQYNVPPEKICIEVTERVFLGSGAQHVSDALERLAELGVEIALDDFGTGYASLSHIKAYPIGRLKIDRSFVSDMQDNKDSLSIVQAIVQLGRSLGLAITAEGVEEEEQAVLLRSMGCGSLQGYLFSKPRPAAELGQFLKAKSPRGTRVA